MESYLALINNGKVENVIVVSEKTDETYFTFIQSQYEQTIDVSDMNPIPSPGWVYSEGIFTNPIT
jgi:hypothetical protein